MDNVIIDKSRDVIIIEKHDGDTILKGSYIFCGCCGESLGFLTEDITFPFDSKDLIRVLADKSFCVTVRAEKKREQEQYFI